MSYPLETDDTPIKIRAVNKCISPRGLKLQSRLKGFFFADFTGHSV